jgi:flagellar assembly factor FliW
MVQLASDLSAEGVKEAAPLFGHPPYCEELSKAVFAVNDAGNLADALDVNLDWMVEALSTREISEKVRNQLRASVEVCRQLTRLLGGAIGSCRAAANTTAPRPASVQLSRVAETALQRISALADSLGILVLSEAPRDLWVTVDSELLSDALATLVRAAVERAPEASVVRMSSTRCGRYAVIGLTSEGPGLSTLRLEELCAAGTAAHEEGNPPSLCAEGRRSISTMLLEQGGHIDVEIRPDGSATLFVVVPACDETIEDPVESGTVIAERHDSPGTDESVPGENRSAKMIVQSDRFGAIEVDASDVVTFPSGVIGFPRETEFVIVRKVDSQIIGWLQSTKTSYLTLPVVSAHALAGRFPDVPIEEYAERAGLGGDIDELAVMVVLSAPPGQPATVNLMAPVIVNAATRTGAQIMLEGTRFSTRELFVLPATAALDLERTATAMPNEVAEVATATSAAE